MIQWGVIFERIIGFLKSLTFARILEIFKTISLYWLYLWPVLYCMSVISDKYWGNNNPFEQFVEAWNKAETGVSVDISQEAARSSEPHDLKKYIPNER